MASSFTSSPCDARRRRQHLNDPQGGRQSPVKQLTAWPAGRREVALAQAAMPTTIAIDPILVRELEDSLDAGPMLDASGRRMLNEEQIARFAGLSVQIQADEHPPPHFHVRGGGENVSYALDTGYRLPGIKGLERFDRNIEKWWRDNRCELILAWNRLRPADCPVGTVPVPPECEPNKDEADV